MDTNEPAAPPSPVGAAEPPARADRERRRGSSPLWAAVRPLLLRLHFYAGLLIAPFILVAAISGLLYVWTPQIDALVYDHELTAPVGDERVPLTEQIASARAALPEGELNAVRPGSEPDQSTQVLFDLEELGESHRQSVFVDPYTAEVRGSLVSYGSSGALPVRTWVDLLHRNLHMGDAGRVYSELAASWIWVVALGGAALWVGRPRKRPVKDLLLPRPGSKGQRRRLSFHGAIGIWLLLGVLFLSATGLTWSQFAGENVTRIRAALAWETPAVDPAPGRTSGLTGVDVGMDRVLESAGEAGLDGPVEITVPAGPGDGYTVAQLDKQWPTSADSVAVDPGTGEVTDAVRFADYPLAAKLSRWGIDAHMGLLFGVANQVVLTVFVAGLVTVIVLGYRMWWKRRPTTAEAVLPSPPERGAWKALPWWAKTSSVVIACAVGWFLPLLGSTLLAFLVIDAVIMMRNRPRSGVH